MNRVLRSIWRRLRGRRDPSARRASVVSPPVYNANRADPGQCTRSALLVYLSRAFHLPPDDPARLRHQNLSQCEKMVSVLGDLGYRVDVVSRADKTFRVARYYDLVISERVEWEREDRRRLQSATRVFLAATLNHVTHNANLRRRHQSLVERRDCAVR